ncbi:MAG: hypothetical protein QOD53_2439, partial [Thermoleophilaceae bacterium]|nr:hypothetical protein [Thermoleophilaceae bacterium]
LVLLYLYGPRSDRRPPEKPKGRRLPPRYPLRPDVLWLALVPLGVAGYSAYLGIKHGDALAWAHLQDAWFRHFAGPFGGLWEGARSAWDGVSQLVNGSGVAASVNGAAVDRTREAVENIGLFGFALAAVVATAGTFRRLPAAYGAYVVAALALPLSFPAHGQPLMSLPRFLAVLFPLFIWLALWCEERRRTTEVMIVFAALLGLFTAQYAAWEWVA